MLVFKEAWWKSYYKQNIKTTKPITYINKSVRIGYTFNQE